MGVDDLDPPSPQEQLDHLGEDPGINQHGGALASSGSVRVLWHATSRRRGRPGGIPTMKEIPENSTILVVDDHEVIAQALAATLRFEGCTVTHVVPNGSGSLLEDLLAHRADVVLLDLELGAAGDGQELIGPLIARGVDVIVLTGVTDKVRRGRCIRAGAAGVMSKHQPFDHLRDAVSTVARGGQLLTDHEREEALASLRRFEDEQERALRPFDELSPREAAVLGALMDGQSVADIASMSFVATSTVRSQVRAILRKLGVSSQLAAVARAQEAGWLGPSGAG